MNDTTHLLRPVKTLNGKWDAYCHVCWAPVYRLWADRVPPDNTCVHGCKAAHECPDAMGRARATAEAIKIIAEEKARKAGEAA